MSAPIDTQYTLSTHDAAEYLGVSHRTLQSWRTKGQGPAYVKFSRNGVLYRAQDLRDFVDARVVGGGAK